MREKCVEIRTRGVPKRVERGAGDTYVAARIPSTSAAARPATEVPYSTDDAQVGVRHENGSAAQQPYSPAAEFRTEIQTQLRRTSKPFSLSSTFKPGVQTPASTSASSNPGSVIREIRTVAGDGNTLPIVLSAVALAIALCSVAYAWFRLARIQRNPSTRPLAG
jgi:hypothetical protein